MKVFASIFIVSIAFLLTIPSAAYAVSPNIVNAITFVESSNRPFVESVDGCRGLGQIKKETWYWVCDLMGKHWSFDEAFDPEKNRIVTEYYLNWLERYLKKRGHYSLDLLCACYNAGPGVVRRNRWRVPPYRETREYIRKVQRQLNMNSH